MKENKEPAAVALSHSTVAMVCKYETLTIFESQQEYGEDSAVAVMPAKSICLNTAHTKKLRDFLNKQFPPEVES